MKHIRKSFLSAKLLLAFLLSFCLGATTLLHGEGILILIGLSGNTDKDNTCINEVEKFCNDWNKKYYTSGDSLHFSYDTFSSVDEAHDKAGTFLDIEECFGGRVGVFGHGKSDDTITINGVGVNTSNFDSDLIFDVYHCLKGDGSSEYYTVDLVRQLVRDLGYE